MVSIHIQAGYCSLIGNNRHSWGWDLGRNVLRKTSIYCNGPPGSSRDPSGTNKLAVQVITNLFAIKVKIGN